MSDTVVPDAETCGRGIWDSKKAKSPVQHKVFLEKPGIRNLSTDRLDTADLDVLCKLHDEERPPQVFKGWGTLTVGQAKSVNCTVIEDIIPENQWHANIVLPEAAADIVVAKQIATSLATMAKWKPR